MPEIRERVITENDLAWAFPTNIPIVPGHMIVAPRRCVTKIDDLTSNELVALIDLRKKVALALKKVFGAKGFNYAWNEGAVAGQSVPHFHLHIVPRKDGDAGITKYEPRKFLYRPGSRKKSPESELVEVAELIKREIKEA